MLRKLFTLAYATSQRGRYLQQKLITFGANDFTKPPLGVKKWISEAFRMGDKIMAINQSGEVLIKKKSVNFGVA